MRPHLLLTLAALGCAGGSPATTATPSGGRARVVPTAAKALVNASVQVTFRATLTAISEVPLEIELVDEDRGLVETQYFDLTPFEWRAERYPPAERVVRLRVTVAPDTLGRGSRVAVYVLYQPRQGTGMTLGRASERAVASDHPGTAFGRTVMDRIERKAIGTSAP